MHVSVLIHTIGALTLIALAACGRQAEMTPLVMPALECMILPGAEETADSITVALLDEVEPEHAPQAHNTSEQLLFRHLYENLITVDCRGEVQAGLAESWSRGEGGRLWTFRLREEACFWDGTPVTASDVMWSWQRTSVETMAHAAGFDSTTSAGDRVLYVYLDRPNRKVPLTLSSPAFAVAKWSAGSQWPLGTGPYRIEASDRGSAGVPWQTITAYPVFDTQRPVIQFIGASMPDTRDLLEGKVDMMVTADPAVIEYASSRPHLSLSSLPWNKTYVLLSTSRVRELQLGGTVGSLPLELSDGLARDAVRCDARGYRPKSWWDDLLTCGEPSTIMPGPSPSPRGSYITSDLRRILYDLTDPVARGLAERIVALAATDPTFSPETSALDSAVPGLTSDTPRTIAEGVTQDELDLSLQDGDDFAYIVPVPRRTANPCYEARKLINRAKWLAVEGVDLHTALLPLVDTRQYVIARRGRVALSIDWNGDILIVNGMLRGR